MSKSRRLEEIAAKALAAPPPEPEPDRETVELTWIVERVVLNPDKKSTVLAMCNVELILAGVVLSLRGIQIRRVTAGKTTYLRCIGPQHRNMGGNWDATILLPDAARSEIARSCLEAFAQEAGIVGFSWDENGPGML